ncbi:MAG: type VI secretion protein IcmF/TssM N-terminal domain-containing protein [Planctomycetota bacterium]
MKLGIGVAAVGAIAGPLVVLASVEVLLVVVGGAVAVGLLLVLYRVVLSWLDKRKSQPFERQLAQNAAAAPKGVGDAAKRARLDDLRRKFDVGVKTFREHGKSVYALPWYLLVGEPGSGKTEAIRNCNVGFPPGLQDTLQGSGGTLNMNWWFTNHAVILDTAGRLMFEDVAAGDSSEWKSFLQLLRSARSTAPVNGLLLVIPADSLIKDSRELIEAKAGKIAAQLDAVQRTLGVRFPAFVIVTKSDLINGFREFFDSIEDPSLQHQIMGWSNPDPLDAPFDPGRVDQHLASVRERIVRRRYGLLQDPVHTQDSKMRRIDQVDASYAFPEALMQLAPRLRTYLETVFVGGEWSAKPLFLRGIYFTSAMREGSALDADLAEALGIDVEQLPEGRSWQKDRAFFLRHLFLDKVFRERGLVTRASNAKKMQARRRGIVLGAAAVTVSVLVGLTLWAGLSYRATVGQYRDLWAAAEDAFVEADGMSAIVEPENEGSLRFVYRGGAGLDLGAETTTFARFGDVAADVAAEPIEPPAVFAPLASFGDDPNALQRDAIGAVVEGAVLGPIVQAARDKLRGERSLLWGERARPEAREQAAAAMLALIRLELAEGPSDVDLRPLATLVLQDAEDREAFGRDYDSLRTTIDRVYGEWGRPWPPATVGVGTDESRRALLSFVDGFIESERFRALAGGESSGSNRVGTLVDAYVEREEEVFGRLLNELLSADGASSHGVALRAFERGVNELSDAAVALQRSQREAGDAGAAPNGGVLGDITARFNEVREAAGTGAELRQLRARLRDGLQGIEAAVDASPAAGGGSVAALVGTRVGLAAERAAALVELVELAEQDAAAFAGVASGELRGHEAVDALLKFVGETSADAPSVFEDRREDWATAVAATTRRLRSELVASAASEVAAGEVPDGLALLIGPDVAAERLPDLPLVASGREIRPEFTPAAARAVAKLSEAIADDGTKLFLSTSEARRVSSARRRLDAYPDAFVALWEIVATPDVPTRPWREIHRELVSMNVDAVVGALAELDAAIDEARRALPGTSLDGVGSVSGSSRASEIEAMVSALADLGPDAAAAGSVLGELSPGEFERSYLAGFEDAGRYWQNVLEAALRSIAAGAGGDDSLAELRALKAFPLCAGTGRRLSAAEWASAVELIDELSASASGQASGSAEADTIAGGAMVGIERIDDALQPLRGQSSLDREDRLWLRALQRIATLFGGDPVSFEIVVPDGLDQREVAAQRFVEFAVVVDGAVVANADGESRFSLDALGEVPTGVTLQVPAASDVELRFFANRGAAEAAGVASVPEVWTFVELIVENRLDRLADNAARRYRVPLRTTGEVETEVLIDVSFDAAIRIPDPRSWPTAESWPGGAP